ncbi:hypothetical protein Hanom_Chr02g00157571 [Helianthus anomalus]
MKKKPHCKFAINLFWSSKRLFLGYPFAQTHSTNTSPPLLVNLLLTNTLIQCRKNRD